MKSAGLFASASLFFGNTMSIDRLLHFLMTKIRSSLRRWAPALRSCHSMLTRS